MYKSGDKCNKEVCNIYYIYTAKWPNSDTPLAIRIKRSGCVKNFILAYISKARVVMCVVYAQQTTSQNNWHDSSFFPTLNHVYP